MAPVSLDSVVSPCLISAQSIRTCSLMPEEQFSPRSQCNAGSAKYLAAAYRLLQG